MESPNVVSARLNMNSATPAQAIQGRLVARPLAGGRLTRS
jgi:hypothetical protein